MTDTDLINRLRSWSHLRQQLTVPAQHPEQALQAVIAVYATHPTAPLALWARSRSFSAARYRQIDLARKGLRVPGMRGTIFLTPRRNAPRIFTALHPPAARVLRALRRHDLSTRNYEQLAKRVLAAARKPIHAADLEDAAGIAGQPLGTVLRCLRYEGRLLALGGDSLNSSAHRYVAASAWVPEGLDAGDPGKGLSWLAGEYLRAYGPARVVDFAWWAGVTKRAAAQAVAPHDTIDLGEGLLPPAKNETAFSRVRPVRGTVDLLPKWDPYTMGHAPDGRQRLVHPDVQHRVYTPIRVGLPGDGNPVILVDGEAVATWTFTLKDGPEIQPFDTFGPRIHRKINEKLDAVARLLSQ